MFMDHLKSFFNAITKTLKRLRSWWYPTGKLRSQKTRDMLNHKKKEYKMAKKIVKKSAKAKPAKKK